MFPIFPNNARGAVSLTYDDATPDHLDAAIVDLESSGLRGTFFIPTRTAGASFLDRAEAWRHAVVRGHEIGNHTQYHPCAAGPDWVKPNFSLEAYTLARMEAELATANRDLDEVAGAAERRSFAYPCCQSYIGPDQTSYRPMAARLFPACRGGPGRKLVDPFDCDFAFIPAWVIRHDTPLEHVLQFIDDAVEDGRWAVLVFHTIGGRGPLAIPRATHQSIVEYVAARRAEAWCETFLKVAQHIRQATRRPWQ